MTKTKVSNIVRVGFDAGWKGVDEKDEGAEGVGNGKEVRVGGECKMAWLWVEGWRARLRAGGRVVEGCRRGFDEDGDFE